MWCSRDESSWRVAGSRRRKGEWVELILILRLLFVLERTIANLARKEERDERKDYNALFTVLVAKEEAFGWPHHGDKVGGTGQSLYAWMKHFL